MKKLALLFVVSFMSILTSCKKPTTNLELALKDESGSAVSGATVQLFKTEDDWLNKTNAVAGPKSSDASGKVTFTDLTSIAYFVYAEKDCISNTFEGVQTSPLTEKKTTQTTLALTGTGTLRFVNKTNNKHRIGINGVSMLDVAGNSSANLTLKKGRYTVRILQIENVFSTTNPTDKSSDINLDCGQTTSFDIP